MKHLASSYHRCTRTDLYLDDDEYFFIESPEATYKEQTTPDFWLYVEELFPKEYNRLPEANRIIDCYEYTTSTK